MMFFILEETLEYLNTQESLRSESFTQYYLCIKKYIGMSSTLKHIPQVKHKTIH